MKKDMMIARSNGALEAPPPDWLVGEAGAGAEEAAEADLRLPTVQVLQPLSPEVLDGRAGAGEFVNRLTGQSYGREITFVPVKLKKRRMLFHPRESGLKDIRCQAPDGIHPMPGGEGFKATSQHVGVEEGAPTCEGCPFTRFRDGPKRGPECIEYYVFAGCIVGHAEPVALSFASTGIKVARKLISMARYGPGANKPLWACRYKLVVVQEKNDKGTWYTPTVAPAGWQSDRALFEACKALYAAMQARAYTIEAEQPPADAAPPDDNPF